MTRLRHAVLLLAIGAMVAEFSIVGAAAQGVIDLRAEPEDKLGAEDRRLVAELTRRQMPELVESLLRGGPRTYYIYIARAYAAAAPEVREQSASDQFFEKAKRYFLESISLEDDGKWFKGLRRSVAVTEWRIEFAEFLLRRQAAPDLDRFEITSGLEFNRARLEPILEQSLKQCEGAATRLDDFQIGLRTREQDFLLLGLTTKIPRLANRHAIISAWTNLYLGQIDRADSPLRKNRLQSALDGFDRIAAGAKNETTRYNATIGVGIALRELRRYSEAEIAFNRVIDSTAASAIVTRARHEKARLHLQSGSLERARKEWSTLAAQAEEDSPANEAFYLRLAPVMLAYVDIQNATAPQMPPTEQLKYRNEAAAVLNRIAAMGGAWYEIANVYLGLLDEKGQDFAVLASDDLFATATRLLASDRTAEAIDAWQALLKRSLGPQQAAQARFNLGLSYLAAEEYEKAAESMDLAARDALTPEMSRRAAEVRYQCRRSLSGTSQSKKAFLTLAEAAQDLVNSHSDSDLAEEAAWVIGLALQEAGDFVQARQAYARVPPSSKHYWEARRGEALCAQEQFENQSTGAQADARQRSAQVAVDLWRRLVADLNEQKERQRKKDGSLRGLVDEASLSNWLVDARLAAAGLLASEALNSPAEALAMIEGVAAGARSVGLRLRCLRATGQSRQAEEELSNFIEAATREGASEALLDLASGLERDMDALLAQDRFQAAKDVAQDAAPLLRQLFEQVKKSKKTGNQAAVIEFSLARALGISGELEEARPILDRLIAQSPENGQYLVSAARMEEQISGAWTGAKRDEAADRAEKFWSMLLKDATLREQSPEHYWEARYRWLSHQLRHGRAADVVKGVESEQAWYPDFGGTKWKGPLLELAAEARKQLARKNR